ncbi:MAG: PmoA family protein [Cyclobacteriaceae bacterium]|nr:PmoA family protein [Cyclobacteriaceae bacterium]
MMKIPPIFILWLPLYMTLTAACDNNASKNEGAENQDEEKRIQVIEREDKDRVDVLVDGTLFTSYIYSESIKKPVLFPVNTSSGIPVTRGYPMAPKPWEKVDHPHHIGIWLNHGDVNDLDFWNNSDSVPPNRKMHYGTIFHRSVKKTRDGNEQGYLEVEAEWNRPDNRTLIRENSTFYFSGRNQVRIIDRISTLTASNLNVLFKDSKEGMMGIRVIRELEHPENQPMELLNEDLIPVRVNPEDDSLSSGLYVSSEGLEGDDVWGTRARWVKLASEINGTPVGIVIMDHPDNPNHPTHWHARGYGLFAANPFGSKMFTEGRETMNFFLSQDESVVFKYRIYIYDGPEPDAEDIERNYEEFSSTYLSDEEEQ